MLVQVKVLFWCMSLKHEQAGFFLSGLKTGTTGKKKSTDINMLMLLVTSKQANYSKSLNDS